MTVTNWRDIDPADATGIDCSERPDIIAPLNELGQRCPWPWEPQQRQRPESEDGRYYPCPFCGACVEAAEPHIDYAYTPIGWHDGPKPANFGTGLP
jgi:hypothetical protein